MNRSALRAELAVMSILRDRKAREQGFIDIQRVRSAWSHYGLRRTDLPLAIDRLEALGLVIVDQDRGRNNLALTDHGRRWNGSVFRWAEWLHLLPRLLKRRLQLRADSNSGSRHPARRATDVRRDPSGA
jgi:hypothetical protein